MKRFRTIALAMILLITGCGAGVEPPSTPGDGAGSAVRRENAAAASLANASLGEARRAFLAAFNDEDVYGRAPEPGGFQYKEKETLKSLPVESLLAGIEKGLAGERTGRELAFWLDLFSIVPDRAPGASRVMLDYLASLEPGDERYMAYQAAHLHLSRLINEQDAESAVRELGNYEDGLQYLILCVLRGKGVLTAEKAVDLLKRAGVDPQAAVAQLEPVTAEVLSLLEQGFSDFKPGAQVAVVDKVGDLARWGPDDEMKKRARAWLDSALAKSSEPAVRQETLYQMYRVTGSRAPLGRLVAEVERDGAAPGLHFWGSHYLLRDIRSGYPGSYLARGFDAYERVRGRPYFVVDYWDPWRGDEWPFKYGAEQYEPSREIPGWIEFLRVFPKHPGADDAAYRLGRSYEIEGDWRKALTWLVKAGMLPDGDLQYDARGRLLFVLDARVPFAELERLAGELADGSSSESADVPAVASILRPLVDYTLAVRDLREDDYQGASKRLAAFIADYGDMGPSETVDLLLGGATGLRYPFWKNVREQQEWLLSLAKVASQLGADPGDRDPEALYRIGADIYHNQFLYYNYLWAGARQGFNWTGHINELWGETPEGRAYLAGLINYQHSFKWFDAAEKSPRATDEIKAKALYSQGLAYIGVLQWGQDAETVFGEKAVRSRVAETFERFVKTHPGSSMADDALLALYAYTGDKAHLERLLKDYPEGDRAGDARRILAKQVK